MRFAQAEPLIHVGPHKTATTWLQDVVLGPKDGEELVYCFDFPATHEAFLRPAWGDFDPRRARARLSPWLERSEETGLPLIVTDETLSGYPFHHRFDREVAALRMAEAFPRARILVTIREQKAVIDSMYGQYLRYGYSSPIEEFVDPGDDKGALRPILERAYYDYDRLLDLYEGLFGAGRVLMLPMEWMTRNPTEAMARLSAFIGAEITAPAPTSPRHARMRLWAERAARPCGC
ncbi:sulfotransferase [Albimonas sp. CAU 1670]|uniref:sulfotransferase n=1 Tax=Albimonas sp. CAU 1670 TaxID=3032599 RepID=UPI0023DBE101|nr:sulfotransferase [Albimonas sp. CAU 1670]MDF2232646.1 sulfotransferase [Albimonas sp. CAU 1670]